MLSSLYFAPVGTFTTELCLSVLVGDTIQRRAQALDVGSALDVLKRYLAGGNQRLLDAIAVVYPEADCCLCLEPGPNVVFAKCGHACAHLACVAPSLIKCPLCRARIFATIKLV